MSTGKETPAKTPALSPRQAYQKVLAEFEDEVHRYMLAMREQSDIPVGTLEKIGQLRVALIKAWKAINPIRLARHAQGFTVQAVASQTGVSHPTIAAWENGAVQFPSIVKMERVATFLGEPDLRTQWEQWVRERPPIFEAPQMGGKTPGGE